MPTGGGDPAAGYLRVGAALREERSRRGLSLEDVAQGTRFTARQVQAVEDGRVADFPPHPYARGLVTAYAIFLGLDAEAAAREWGRPTVDGESEGRSIFRVPVRARSSWRDWAVPLACALATAVHIFLRPASGTGPSGTAGPYTPFAPPAPRPVPQQELEAATPAPEPPAAAESPGVLVVLRSEGTTWVDAAPDGAAPSRLELRPGQNLTLQARSRLGLGIGDTGAVRITVNGRDLGFIGDKGEPRQGIVFEAPPPVTAKGVAGAAASGTSR